MRGQRAIESARGLRPTICAPHHRRGRRHLPPLRHLGAAPFGHMPPPGAAVTARAAVRRRSGAHVRFRRLVTTADMDRRTLAAKAGNAIRHRRPVRVADRGRWRTAGATWSSPCAGRFARLAREWHEGGKLCGSAFGDDRARDVVALSGNIAAGGVRGRGRRGRSLGASARAGLHVRDLRGCRQAISRRRPGGRRLARVHISAVCDRDRAEWTTILTARGFRRPLDDRVFPPPGSRLTTRSTDSSTPRPRFASMIFRRHHPPLESPRPDPKERHP